MTLASFIAEKTLAGLLLPGILVVVVFLVIFLVARRQSRPAPTIGTHSSPPDEFESDSQIQTDSHLPAYSSSYHKPLFLLLDAAPSPGSAILRGLREALPANGHNQRGRTASGIAHFRQGSVLAAGGDLFAQATNGKGSVDEWKKLAAHLHRQRPERPLDGVVLAFPCADFSEVRAPSPEQSQQRAAHISKSLQSMRDQLGFSFPVYVLITGCDQIQGFQEFAGSQLLSHSSEIFGWSNPYNLDAPFDPRWSKQAFAYTKRVIEEQRVYLLSRSHNGSKALDPSVRDEAFLFPARFRSLETPISEFLAALFRTAGHRDALQFRGLYFSGNERPQNGKAPNTTHVNAGKPEFIADLFAQKVFPERGLAHPVDTELAPRNREAYLAKALCWLTAAALFSGTGLAWHALAAIRDNTLPRMKSVVTALSADREQGQPEPAYDAIFTAQALSGNNFRSVFLPFSLISDFDANLGTTMPHVFDKLVYEGLRSELKNRANQLPIGPGLCEGNQSVNTVSIVLPCLHPASRELSAFVNGLNTSGGHGLLSLEDNIVLFNRVALGGSGNGRDLLTLAVNLAPTKFAGFPRKPSATLDAIVAKSHGEPFDGGPFTQQMVSRIEALASDVLRQRLDEDLLAANVAATTDQVNRLEAQELNTNEQLAALSKSLKQVQDQLASPNLEWLAKSEYQLPPDISQALDPVFERAPSQNLLLCGREEETESCAGLIQLRLFIWPAAHTHALDFRTKLLASRTNLTGDVVVGTDDKLQLSPGALVLQSALDGFLKLPFVETAGTAQIHEITAGEQLLWNNNMLQNALKNKAAYDKFIDDLANTEDVQAAFADLALDRLESSMTDSVASAQEIQPLPSSDKVQQATFAEAEAFAAAAQPLSQLLQAFSENDLNFDDGYRDLLEVSTEHALMVLRRVDNYFDSQNFYWPAARNFDSWNGDAPPSSAVYAKKNVEDMQAYLALQRQDWQPYVVAAKPLATFLQQRAPRDPKQLALISKWMGIVNDVQKYDSAPASSTLGSLESYLATEMDKTVPPDCKAAASPTVPVYFAQTQRSIERVISAHCLSLTHRTGSDQYNQLAQFFNSHLACKFPFANQTCTGPPDAEADPADVVELFRLLDAENKALHEAIDKSASAHMTFVNQLEALRPIFASLLSTPPAQAPAWDFVPVFRTNRGHEINGNQIIDWTLAAGNAAFRNSDPLKIGHWSFGQPVALTLRWAKDSPNRPVAEAPANNLPDTRTVVYEYHDPWALLRMLVEHAAPGSDFDHKVDPDPQTLAFTIAQQVVPEPVTNGRKSALIPGNQIPGPDVKVFVGIRLYAPGKTTSLPMPVFPVRAPTPWWQACFNC